MTDNLAVARALREIGALLAISGDNRYRARAYEAGARAVEQLSASLEQLVADQRLTDLRGIGPALASVISELVTTGTSAQLQKLRAAVPPGTAELSTVPGLTLKRIGQLHAALGIESIAQLREALENDRVRDVPGFGPKSAATLLASLDKAEEQARDQRTLLVDALEEAVPFLAHLRNHPAAQEVEFAGSVRRWKEAVGDVDLVVASDEPEAILEHAVQWPTVNKVLHRDGGEAVLRLDKYLHVELHVVAPGDFPATLARATGSPAHVAKLEARAAERGVDAFALATSERDVYARLDLQWIEPELRDDAGEVEAAAAHTLPALVELADIRGMTHCHTTFSDGRNSVEEMVREAEAMGMQYLTITDHSPAAHYAGGVQLDQLQRQWDEIARVQETTQVRLLRGTESDILEDGALDYPDKILEQLDIVIASVHSRMKMDAATMTKRLVNCMRQPVFKVWGHALGRLVLKRDPFACDVERVLDAIAESRAAIEVNGDPYRLDMAPEHLRKARQRGIRFVISTDAHSTRGMHNLRFGVATARRGWLTRDEVLNTRDADAFAQAVRPTGG